MGIVLTLENLIPAPTAVREKRCHDCPFNYMKNGDTLTTDYVRDGQFLCHNEPLLKCKGFEEQQPNFTFEAGPVGPRMRVYCEGNRVTRQSNEMVPSGSGP